MNSCTLLISTYNWPEALELCLKSVSQQTILPTEIIIADDGSKEETRRVIEEFQRIPDLNIIHIWHEDKGFRLAEIRNKAVLASSQGYIIQIDGDIILDKYFIEDHLHVAEKGCFIRGSRAHIEKDYLSYLFSKKQIDFNFLSRGVKHWLNAVRFPFLADILIKRVSSGTRVKGCNLAFWKNDFLHVNGYNNDLQGWGHEDEELTSRFVNAGLLKKIVKFRCVQYHIYHKLSSRANENIHDKSLNMVRENQIIRCNNGVDEVKSFSKT